MLISLQAYMDAYFKKIHALQQDRSLAPRLRFMLMDLLDLRGKVRLAILHLP
jgi:hypothetical protein